jgi:hypothetical protein
VSSADYYAGLPVLTEFSAVADAANYLPLPLDWHVATCDVRNSTQAVQAGNYKHVNTVGASAVTAMLNAAGDLEIPFIFEGDGSAFCVPPGLLEDTKAALMKTQEMARSSFGLELRVATIPVATIREAGHEILIARVRVSENYIQAAFAGGGMAYADRYMKDPKTAALCEVKPGGSRVPLAGHPQPPRRNGEPDGARHHHRHLGGDRALQGSHRQGAGNLRQRRGLPPAHPALAIAGALAQRAPARQRGRRARR